MEVVRFILISIVVYVVLAMIVKLIKELYYEYKIKPKCKFVAYDMYSNLYLGKDNNRFCEQNIENAIQFDLPKNNDETYLSLFLVKDREALIYVHDNLKLAFIVINPINYEKILQIDV